MRFRMQRGKPPVQFWRLPFRVLGDHFQNLLGNGECKSHVLPLILDHNRNNEIIYPQNYNRNPPHLSSLEFQYHSLPFPWIMWILGNLAFIVSSYEWCEVVPCPKRPLTDPWTQIA